MNILIVYAVEPFTQTKCEDTALLFQKGFTKFEHTVQILRLPITFIKEMNQNEVVLALNLLKIDNTELLITLNEPACYLSHTNHIFLLDGEIHALRLNMLKSLKTIWCVNTKIQNQLVSLKMKQVVKFVLPTSNEDWIKLNKQILNI